MAIQLGKSTLENAKKPLRHLAAGCLLSVLWFGPWRSLVAHLHGVQGVVSSSLTGPTNLRPSGASAFAFLSADRSVGGASLPALAVGSCGDTDAPAN